MDKVLDVPVVVQREVPQIRSSTSKMGAGGATLAAISP